MQKIHLIVLTALMLSGCEGYHEMTMEDVMTEMDACERAGKQADFRVWWTLNHSKVVCLDPPGEIRAEVLNGDERG